MFHSNSIDVFLKYIFWWNILRLTESMRKARESMHLLYTVYRCTDNVTLWDPVHHEGGVAPHQ